MARKTLKYAAAYILSGLLFWMANGLHYVVNWCYEASEKIEGFLNERINWL